MQPKYYVCVYFDRKEDYTPASGNELLDLAFQHRYNGHGDPRMGIPALAKTPEPGDLAFTFHKPRQAADFARKALGLENIIGVRIGLCR